MARSSPFRGRCTKKEGVLVPRGFHARSFMGVYEASGALPTYGGAKPPRPAAARSSHDALHRLPGRLRLLPRPRLPLLHACEGRFGRRVRERSKAVRQRIASASAASHIVTTSSSPRPACPTRPTPPALHLSRALDAPRQAPTAAAGPATPAVHKSPAVTRRFRRPLKPRMRWFSRARCFVRFWACCSASRSS